MDPLLIFFDVEGPVAIKIAAQVNGSELDDGLGDGLGPAHSRTLHPVLDQVLAGAFDRTTGNGPALGQVLVIAHPSAIAVKVARYARKHFVLGSEKSALGGALAKALDNLAHLAAEDAQGALPNPHLCLRASFGMKHVRCFPEFLQNMKQIEDQGDIQYLVDPDL